MEDLPRHGARAVPYAAGANGAIYQAGHDVTLFENSIARRVGDTVTINLVESTAAQKSSSTTTEKKTDIDIAGDDAGRQAGDRQRRAMCSAATMNNKKSFDGSGDSQQSNRLQGDITVTVAQRLANGNLVVRGQKWIGINQGKEYIRIQGVIRPIDILPDNTIPSSQGCRRHDFLWWPGRACRRQQPRAGCHASSTLRGHHSDMKHPRSSSLLLLLIAPLGAQAERVKDIASVAGVRGNQLVGYGLVVGLDGTGDQTSQAPFTIQSIKNMLAKFGVTIPPNANPQLKNVAAVTVTADLPAFSKPGQTIDVTVSSIGNAASLRGGTPADDTAARQRRRGLWHRAGQHDRQRLRRAGQGRLALRDQRAQQRPCAQWRNGGTRGSQQLSRRSPIVVLNLNTPDFTTASRLADGHQCAAGRRHGAGHGRRVGARQRAAGSEPAHRLPVDAGGRGDRARARRQRA